MFYNMTWLERILWLKRIKGGGSYIIKTLSGVVPPITINDAIKSRIKSLVQYGKCDQSGTPTPSAPIDIKCNNGTIKAKHESGLPLGYQKLDYISGSVGQTVVNTGVRGNLANLRIVFRGKKTSHTAYSPFFGNYRDENTNVTRVIEGGNASTPVLYTYNRKAGGGSASATDIRSEDAHTYDLSSNGLLVDNDKSFPIRDVSGTSNSTNIAICSSSVPASAASSGASTVFAYFKIYQGDTLIRNYVPVKRLSDNKVGFYELVNNTFEQGLFASSYAFTAGSPVDDPVEIYVDGTPETLTVVSETTQTASVENLLGVGDYKDEQNIVNGAVTRACGIKIIDGTENWELHTGESGTYRLDDVFADLAQGVPILSSLLCTHFFATNTLATLAFTTGMARWGAISDGSVAVSTQGTRLYACFGVSTVEEVKAWLAAQYAAGTPVIVLYPLASPTTEQTTPQHLSTVKGDHLLTVTAEVAGITFDVTYTNQQ